MKRKAAILVALMAFCLGSTLIANADVIATLRLTSGASTVTITDGGAGDTCLVAGCITFSGSVGDWIINVSTGLTSPVLAVGSMDLAYQDAKLTGTPASSISISFTTQGNSKSGFLNTDLGGTNNNTTTAYAVYFDNSDTAFGMANLVASFGPTGASPVNFLGGGSVAGDSSFSVTQVVTIAGGAGAANASGDAQLTIPEPASMSILGAGLIGLAGLFRRRLAK